MSKDFNPRDPILVTTPVTGNGKPGYQMLNIEKVGTPAAGAQFDLTYQQKLKRIKKVGELKRKWEASSTAGARDSDTHLPTLPLVADDLIATAGPLTRNGSSSQELQFPTLLEQQEQQIKPENFVWPQLVGGLASQQAYRFQISNAPIKPYVFRGAFEPHLTLDQRVSIQPDWSIAQIGKQSMSGPHSEREQLFQQHGVAAKDAEDMRLGLGFDDVNGFGLLDS